jgi:flagellin
MNINSLGTSNFSLNIGQNKNATDGVLQKLAALHTITNESPADLIIYNQQQSDMLVASQKVQNANESYSMLRVSDNALQSLKESAMELNTQSVARNSAALNSDQKAMIDADSNALMRSMKDTVEQTTYNGQQLLSDIKVDSIDASNQESVQNFMSMLDRRLGDVGAAMNATVSEINQQSSLVTNLAYSKETKEYDVADLVNQLRSGDTKLNASLFAQAHSSESLAQRIGTLLG